MSHSIDLKFRPRSYFWANDLGVRLSSQIKGAERKAMYEASVANGIPEEEIHSHLLDHALSRENREILGSLHPNFLGGEYLPDCSEEEVEIARITIASTTQDVTSVYARQGKSRIYYRVVDEYDGDTLSNPSVRTSLKPLTLGQLTKFFLGAWNLLDVLNFNFEDPRHSADEIKSFVVDASSSFYAEFGQLIDLRIDHWIRKRQRESEVLDI